MGERNRAARRGRSRWLLGCGRRITKFARRCNLEPEQLEPRVLLSTDTWSGNGNGNWSDTASWIDVTVPVAGDSLVFPAGVTGSGLTSNNDLTVGTSFASLSVSGSGYTIGGNAIGLTGELSASQSSGSSTVNLPINFGSTTADVSVTSDATLVLGGDISGQDGLTLSGAGELNLEATNNYTGTTTVSGGVLHVDGVVSGSVALDSGTTLGGVGSVGSITTTSATVQPGDSGPGLLTDTGALTFDSASTYAVALNGNTAGSQYSQLDAAGPINLASATLQATLGSGFTPSPGTQFTIINNTGSSAVSGTFAGLPQGATLTISGEPFAISYTGGSGHDVILTALATYTWTGADAATNDNWSDPNNWASSAVPVTGNVVVFPSGLSSSALTSNNDLAAGTSFAALEIQGSGYTITGNSVGLSSDVDASQTSGSSTVNLPIDFGTSESTVTVDNSGATLVLGGDISGQNGLTKQGAGELDLEAANGYSGTTTVGAGVLRVNGSVGGAVVVDSGATLGGTGTVGSITTTSATVSPGTTGPGLLTDTGALTFDSASSYDVAIDGSTAASQYSQLEVGGAINLAGATLNVSLSATFTPTAGTQFTIIDNTGSSAITGTFAGLPQGGTITVSGQAFSISYMGGAGNDVVLTAVGTSTWTGSDVATSDNWSDADNWQGDTVPVAGNVLVFPTAVTGSALTSNNDLSAGTSFSSVSIASSGYDITGNSIALTGSIDASQSSGTSTVGLPIDFGTGASTVTVDTSGAVLSLGGDLSGQNGLTKQGAGELDLGGTNAYTGTTTISAGVLHVDGSVTGAVAVSSGATLGGIGTVGSITTTAATVQPGDSGPGLLTDMGDLTLDSSSSYDVALNGTTAGSQYSQLQAGGTIDLAGATLNVTLGFTAPGGSQFTIIKNTGSSPITGTFAGLAQGATLTVSGATFTISYTGGSGHDVVLTAQVPTTTTVTFQPSAPVFGQSVTLTATVTPSASGFGTPTGTVEFENGTTDLGSVALNSSGVATLETSSLPTAANSITATYSGDETFGTSTSAATTVTVAQASTTTTLTASPNPSVLGQVVLLTADVAAEAPGAGTPTGTVEFSIGSTDLGSVVLTNGIALFPTASIPVGTNTLTATYSGDTNFQTGSGTATQQVTAGTVSVAVSASNTNPFLNQPVTLTAILTVTSGTGTPTGTVDFFNSSGTDLGTGTVSNGAATLTVSTLPIGKESITAVYSGDANFSQATSGAISVVVGSHSDLFVNQVYLDVVDLPVDPTANLWIALLNGGYPRGLIVQQIVGSSQARIQAVDNAYATYLGRPATVAEISAALSVRHASSLTVNTTVLGSNEFYTSEGGGTVDGFLTALAEAVLGRKFSSAAQAHYAGQLRRGVSRRQVVSEVLTSPSGVDAQINTLYESILGRPADKRGLAAFATPVRRGRTSRVVDALLSSDEFYENTVNPS
jgi:autotransporter-associated beta strand protein